MTGMAYLIFTAVMLDLVIGDPRFLPHPVVIIGKGIKAGERIIRKFFKGGMGLKTGGVLLVLSIVTGTYLCVLAILYLAEKVHPWLALFFQVWLIYTAVAIKDLQVHARAVLKPLAAGDLPEARRMLSRIVGRDTDNLDEREITRAVVEAVAENTVDGIVAPLFYAFLGGAPLALAYKAVNTLDSMVGYKDDKYLHLGWAAARFDDMVNYLPARIAGLFFILTAAFFPGGMRGAWVAVRRDAGKHPSPNSGIPEAAVAGSLGVKLGGTNYYFGKPSCRAEMGEEKFPLKKEHINEVIKIMHGVTLLTIAAGFVIFYILG